MSSDEVALIIDHMDQQHLEVVEIKSDVAEIKADVAEVKADVAEIKTTVSTDWEADESPC